MPKSNVVDQETRDAMFLKRPDDWPNWPLCPMKRHGKQTGPGDWPESAVAMETDTGFTLLLTNLFDIKADAPRLEYGSAEAVVADGWRVD